jgi:hypothetical protein
MICDNKVPGFVGQTECCKTSKFCDMQVIIGSHIAATMGEKPSGEGASVVPLRGRKSG